jgi:hypothetical protein
MQRMNLGTVFLPFLAIALVACGNGDDRLGAGTPEATGPNAWLVELQQRPEYSEACALTPGCREAEQHADGPQEMIWRVQVIRDAAGEISIGQIDSVAVPRDDGIPPGRATGDYLLVGVDAAGTPVDGQMIQFPRTLRVEYRDRSNAPREIDLAGKRVDTVGYVRADKAIQRLEVQDQNGVAAASATVHAPDLAQAAPRHSSFSLISPAYAIAPISGLPPHCAHVRILQAGEGEIVMINSASYPETDLENKSDPEQQRRAKWKRLGLQATLIHESGHSVEALLNASGADPLLYGGDWQVPARSRAAVALTNTRLRKGFGEEWRRVHNSFVAVDWARAHSISGMLIAEANTRVVSGGFMTSYGSNIWWDDIAEFISETYMGPVLRAEGFQSSDLACQAMQAWSQLNVPSGLAAVYTKLLFLRDLELVKPADVTACAGSVLGLQSMPKGLHFWVNGTHRRSFTNNLQASINTEAIARNKVFTLSGEGEAIFGDKTHPAKLTLRLDVKGLGDEFEEISWPRGVYELGLIGDNNVQLVLDGAPAGNFDATDGFVLVSEATNQRIEGSIVLLRVFRLQAPIPVPEKYDPPVIVRFKLEK